MTCEGCTCWGAASWGRKGEVRNADITTKWCEGWTMCMHEGSTSYQTDDILNSRAKERMGEGWTTCEHGGPTSCQANEGKAGGDGKSCEGWTACVHEGSTSYQTNTGKVGGGGLFCFMRSTMMTGEGCTRRGAASRGRKDKEAKVDISTKWREGWTTCMHEGSTSHQTDRLGEGWTACVHGGPTSYQTSTGEVGVGDCSRSLTKPTWTCESCTWWGAVSCGRKGWTCRVQGATSCEEQSDLPYRSSMGCPHNRMLRSTGPSPIPITVLINCAPSIDPIDDMTVDDSLMMDDPCLLRAGGILSYSSLQGRDNRPPTEGSSGHRFGNSAVGVGSDASHQSSSLPDHERGVTVDPAPSQLKRWGTKEAYGWLENPRDEDEPPRGGLHSPEGKCPEHPQLECWQTQVQEHGLSTSNGGGKSE